MTPTPTRLASKFRAYFFVVVGGGGAAAAGVDVDDGFPVHTIAGNERHKT